MVICGGVMKCNFYSLNMFGKIIVCTFDQAILVWILVLMGYMYVLDTSNIL